MNRRNFNVFAAALAASGFGALPAAASNWPSKPITLVVPYAPGGTADALARVLAQHLGTKLQVSVVVLNKAGASGVIGAAWDSGPTWWARAEGDNADYIHMDVDTEAEAHRLALQGCEEMVSKKGTCKVAGSGSGHGWVAVAETAELFWRGYGETKAEATKEALKKCEKEGCKITKTIENRGNVPEPASMKKVREMQSQSIAKWKKMGKWVE